MWTAPPRREPAPYFFGHRCVFVCVRLCLCVFVYSIVVCACTLELYETVGASCVGRVPFVLCVCRVACRHPSGA